MRQMCVRISPSTFILLTISIVNVTHIFGHKFSYEKIRTKKNNNNYNCNECLRIGSYNSIQLKWEKMEKAHKTNELKICNEYTLPVRQTDTHAHTLISSKYEMDFFVYCDVMKLAMCVRVRWWCLGLDCCLKWLLWWFYFHFLLPSYESFTAFVLSLFCLVSKKDVVGLSLFAFGKHRIPTVNGFVCALHVILSFINELTISCAAALETSRRSALVFLWI